jgi:hypothetical protein
MYKGILLKINLMSVTNPFFGKQEGFGEQYKLLIYYMVFAELNQSPFLYSPFREVAHNYDNDPEFINRLEKIVGLKDVIPNYTDEDLDEKSINVTDVFHFLHKNMEKFQASQSLKTIKNAFYKYKKSPYEENVEEVKNVEEIKNAKEDKKAENVENVEEDKNAKNVEEAKNENKKTHIAIHIRRVNPCDTVTHSGLKVHDSVYMEIIEKITSFPESNKVFHIFSQGKEEDFECYKNKFDVKLHLNESLEDTFLGMVYADILVVAPSALSYVAGLLSQNQVFYVSHCNPPLPSWSVIQGYKSPRMYHKFRLDSTVYFDSETGEYLLFRNMLPFGPLKLV